MTTGTDDKDLEQTEHDQVVDDAEQDETAFEDEGPGLQLIDPDPLDLLREELDQTTARLKSVSAAYQKLQGEFTHFKGRTERQLELKQQILKGDVVSRLFEPMENLRRSIDAMTRGDADSAWVDGMELVYKNFSDGFHDLGLEEIGVAGEIFDTRWHEALTTMPVAEAHLDDTVVQVFSVGFRIGMRCIRPARVIVGTYTAPEPPAPPLDEGPLDEGEVDEGEEPTAGEA